MKNTIYTFFFLLTFTNGYLLAPDPNSLNKQKIDFLSKIPKEIKTEILGTITDPEECIQTIDSLQLVNKNWNVFISQPPIQMIKVENIRKKHSDPNEFIKEIIVLRKNNKTFKKILSRYKRMQYELANDFTKTYSYPLHKAAKFGFAEIVNALIQPDKGLLGQKIDVNKTDKCGNTPLFLAARNGNPVVVKMLLAHNADANKADNGGETPLHWVARNGHTETVKVLLAHNKIDVNKPDTFGRTPLYCAAGYDRTEIVKILLAHNKTDVNKANTKGDTPLHFAACDGHTEVVRELLAHNKIDVNKPNSDGETPLYWAAFYDRTQTVRELLAHKKTDVNKADKYGETPLYWAERNGHTDIVELLKKHLASKENS